MHMDFISQQGVVGWMCATKFEHETFQLLVLMIAPFRRCLRDLPQSVQHTRHQVKITHAGFEFHLNDEQSIVLYPRVVLHVAQSFTRRCLNY